MDVKLMMKYDIYLEMEYMNSLESTKLCCLTQFWENFSSQFPQLDCDEKKTLSQPSQTILYVVQQILYRLFYPTNM